MNRYKQNIVFLFFFVIMNGFLYSQILLSHDIVVTDNKSALSAANTFAYPQSIFVDSPNGNIWITDFDNHRVLRFDISTLTYIGKSIGSTITMDYSLLQNFPNPFNPTTQIIFSVRSTSQATLTVYNLLGQEVGLLFSGVATPNTSYSITFDAKNLPSGMYMYSLRTSGGSEVKKMCLLK